jgi:phosphatidylglycerophosphatase A|tara:strand:- start:397 stop:657 length:261 start_codon:yes stop_codon:yes gene_type:complete
MKTHIRSISESIPVSSGGHAVSIKQTFPSAELIIELGILGFVLFGFLKKHKVKIVKKKPSTATIGKIKYIKHEAIKKINENFQPSG